MRLNIFFNTITILILVNPNFVSAQNPFDFGKGKTIYFISKEERERLDINFIYTLDITKEAIQDQTINFYVINFSNPVSITDGWHLYEDSLRMDSTEIPSLDSLIKNAGFVNGMFYDFENGRPVSIGMGGYGALCYNAYEYTDSATLVSDYCKYAETSSTYYLYYHSNGLVQYKICCSGGSILEDEVIDSLEVTDNIQEMIDTTFYMYDERWRIHKIRNEDKKEYDPIAQALNKNIETDYQFHQCYINEDLFEKYVDKIIKFRPRLILVEIYRNAVFVFKYDDKIKKYFHVTDILLE